MKKATFFSTIALLAAMFMGCDKEEPDSDNQTNNRSTAVFNPNKTYGILTDQDGNVYKTITIGTQTWMAENLRTTKYSDGSDIPNVTITDNWFALGTGAYCNYDNTNSLDTIATFGRLYNWNAVSDSRKLAPAGWHVSTYEEWSILRDYLGGSAVAGGKLKEIGSTHWLEKNGASTNEIGFTALPGGYRNGVGIFQLIGVTCSWWSVNNNSDNPSWDCYVLNNNSSFVMGTSANGFGFSIRCVKD